MRTGNRAERCEESRILRRDSCWSTVRSLVHVTNSVSHTSRWRVLARAVCVARAPASSAKYYGTGYYRRFTGCLTKAQSDTKPEAQSDTKPNRKADTPRLKYEDYSNLKAAGATPEIQRVGLFWMPCKLAQWQSDSGARPPPLQSPCKSCAQPRAARELALQSVHTDLRRGPERGEQEPRGEHGQLAAL